MPPIIGITIGGDSTGDFCLRRKYCAVILRAGGIPLILPPMGKASCALGIVNGLLLTGGGDIAPRLCGITDYDPVLLCDPNPERDEYELELARLAYERDIPTLGICRGLQIQNAALGGSLHFHVDGHEQKRSREQPSHTVHISEDSLLHRLVGTRELEVNSLHHQAVRDCAEGLSVCAVAEDSVVEAAEATGKRFYMGVQWHPEHMDTFASNVIFAALCAAAER